MRSEAHIPTSDLPAWRRPRWRYAAIAFLLGAAETALAMLLGVEFRLGERDFTLVAGGVVEFSFAGFGYLLGLVTEARQRERAAARQANERVAELARMRARLAQAEKLASLGELASALSHELRNPLAILRSMAQNLEESLARDAARSTCREMIEEIDRLDRVTSRLVDFARPLEPRPRPILLTDVAERTRLLAGELLRDRPSRLVVAGGPEVTIDADPDLLCQVLLGLLENAAAVAPGGSAVELSWRMQSAESDETGALTSSRVQLQVADRGPGVQEAIRERVFEPFFTTHPGGHGLGLAVARQIVEAHGGRISAEERPGGGAVFTVCLPMPEPAWLGKAA